MGMVVLLDDVRVLWVAAAYVAALVLLCVWKVHRKNTVIREARRAVKESADALAALRDRIESLGITIDGETGAVQVAEDLKKGWYWSQVDGRAARPMSDEDKKACGLTVERGGFAAEATDIIEKKGTA